MVFLHPDHPPLVTRPIRVVHRTLMHEIDPPRMRGRRKEHGWRQDTGSRARAPPAQ